MCGIVGIFSSEKPISLEIIREMGKVISHRGPDDEGYWVGYNVALGNKRLSIIDLESGKQPMSTADKRYTIVYNGEVFNYQNLRRTLEDQGHQFQTQSDTEVILAGFVKEGRNFLSNLEGMFAFLIYDAEKQTLYAARDAFGIKPLYFYEEKGTFYFSSEIKAIKAGTATALNINPNALRSFLYSGYVPGRETIFNHVYRVSPGTVLSIDAGGKKEEATFIDRLSASALSQANLDRSELPQILINAVERSLVADVPVGLYLSGGIDSSLIASIVSLELGQKLQSFSVSFPHDQTFNEGPYAQQVAKTLGLKHESIEVGPEDFKDLVALAKTLEEPMADPSAIPLEKLSRLASSKLKVVLSGEGGDEFFGGYHRYFWDRFLTRYKRDIPRLAHHFIHGVGKISPSSRIRKRIMKLEETIDLPRHERYLAWFSPFRKQERQKLLKHASNQEKSSEQLFQSVFEAASPLSETAQVQWIDLVTFLRDDLLPKADKMSMINSLEVRVPFLQTDVVYAAFSLSDRERIRARQTKPVLREMLKKYLPDEIVDRKKQGFEVPLGRWFRGPLKSVLDTYLTKSIVENRGYFNWDVIAEILKEHEIGKSDRGLALFSLCFVEAWAQAHLDT